MIVSENDKFLIRDILVGSGNLESMRMSVKIIDKFESSNIGSDIQFSKEEIEYLISIIQLRDKQHDIRFQTIPLIEKIFQEVV